MFQKMGVVKPYPVALLGNDLGRYNVTHNPADKYVFKVSSLRNVAKSYPYFSKGKVWDLKEAIKIMIKYQLGVNLTDDEVDKIAAFLNSLTGEVPKEARELPILPSSVVDTPKPAISATNPEKMK